MDYKTKRVFYFILSFLSLFLILFIIFATYVLVYSNKLKKSSPLFVSEEAKAFAVNSFYKKINYEPNLLKLNRISGLSDEAKLKLSAKSYILLDAITGTIILEKNADAIIPPASLTKLVAIDTALKNPKFKNPELRIIPPKQSWAEFLPEKSSALGLSSNQVLSLNELLLGMSVCSGNDAAIALALYANGSIKEFVKAMNKNIASLKLKHTHFVEPSGLSDNNLTTAREFAKFCLHYLQSHPENLQKFHAIKEITYPKRHNILDIKKLKAKNPDEKIKLPTQKKKATNTLLEKIQGCDGLKTGFIYKSGFNIALTAQRNSSRFLAVILGGEGNSFYRGIVNREKNSIKIMNYAFDNFSTINISAYNKVNKKVIVLGSNLKPENSAFLPIPANIDFSADFMTVNKKFENKIERKIIQAKTLKAPIKAGTEIGHIEYCLKDSKLILKKIPLICPIDIEKGSAWGVFISEIIY